MRLIKKWISPLILFLKKIARRPSLPSRRVPMDPRDGPAQARRTCPEASSVARVGFPLAVEHARGHGSAPAVVVPAVSSPRCDVPSLAPHCARAAGRATHAGTDGRVSSSAEVPRVYRAQLAHATAGRAREEHAHQGGGTRSAPATSAAVPRAREHPHSPPLLLRTRALARLRPLPFAAPILAPIVPSAAPAF